jgi:hypothetical protein
MSNNNLCQELDKLVLGALRTGQSLETVFQTLMAKANELSNAAPIVQAVADAHATKRA